MSRTTTITLAEPVLWHDQHLREIALRPPTFAEYMELGEPYAEGYARSGIYFRNVDYPTVREYAQRLMVDQDKVHALSLLGLADSRKVRDAILDFFREPEASEPSPTASSSGSAGMPGQSSV